MNLKKFFHSPLRSLNLKIVKRDQFKKSGSDARFFAERNRKATGEFHDCVLELAFPEIPARKNIGFHCQ